MVRILGSMKEQLEKKKLETFALTLQKMAAVKTSIEKTMNQEPHLIGSIPEIPATYQQEMALKCWVHQHKQLILSDPSIRHEITILVTQLTVLKSCKGEWENFLTRWGWMRVFHNNMFEPVWADMKDALGIVDHINDHNSNDKDEIDGIDDDDDAKRAIEEDDDELDLTVQ